MTYSQAVAAARFGSRISVPRELGTAQIVIVRDPQYALVRWGCGIEQIVPIAELTLPPQRYPGA